MIVKLLTEHHLEFLSLTGGCRGSAESTHVKMPHSWKSHVTAHISFSCTHIRLKILCVSVEDRIGRIILISQVENNQEFYVFLVDDKPEEQYQIPD